MHYNIIILTNQNIDINNTYIINEKVKLLDDCTILYKEESITFEYLIICDITLIEGHKEVGVLTENKIPVTNYEKQTFVENIYYCQPKDIEEILENL